MHVSLDNSSNRTVHRVRVALLQHVHVCMFTNGRFKNIVGLSETESGHPVRPGSCLSRVFAIRPGTFLRYPVALAVEGGLSGPALRLAPSTVPELAKDKNPYGVTVCYEAKIKAFLGVVDRPVCVRLPFRLIEDPPAIEEDEPVPLAEEEEEPESMFPT